MKSLNYSSNCFWLNNFGKMKSKHVIFWPQMLAKWRILSSKLSILVIHPVLVCPAMLAAADGTPSHYIPSSQTRKLSPTTRKEISILPMTFKAKRFSASAEWLCQFSQSGHHRTSCCEHMRAVLILPNSFNQKQLL